MNSAAEFTSKTRKKSKKLGQREYILRTEEPTGTSATREVAEKNQKTGSDHAMEEIPQPSTLQALAAGGREQTIRRTQATELLELGHPCQDEQLGQIKTPVSREPVAVTR
jgi:hypothetical protein